MCSPYFAQPIRPAMPSLLHCFARFARFARLACYVGFHRWVEVGQKVCPAGCEWAAHYTYARQCRWCSRRQTAIDYRDGTIEWVDNP
jgi:hypothetical protein